MEGRQLVQFVKFTQVLRLVFFPTRIQVLARQLPMPYRSQTMSKQSWIYNQLFEERERTKKNYNSKLNLEQFWTFFHLDYGRPLMLFFIALKSQNIFFCHIYCQKKSQKCFVVKLWVGNHADWSMMDFLLTNHPNT